MPTAIEFNNISKQYRLGLVSTKTLSHDLNRWWTVNVLHKEDPYLKIGSANDRSAAADSEYVWALRNIDFKVEQGDVVGIIGKNGAGKSTLLKLLSKITAPTTGTINARGRIGALLEVGTGFHQEMTGRENIYLNGAIMGMTKQEISRKLDEIVDFSGCERYIDTPVKRYSSGMTVRLGFAVAAFLEPEILVVDEVLAVGDAEFQKKAIGKMQDVSRGEGRTVLFVSHNMTSIRQLCKTGVLLDKGETVFSGNISETVDYYLKGNLAMRGDVSLIDEHNIQNYRIARDSNIHPVEIIEAERLNKYVVDSKDPVSFRLRLRNNYGVENVQICCLIDDALSEARTGLCCSREIALENGKMEIDVVVKIDALHLTKGRYMVNFWIGKGDIRTSMHFYDRIFNSLTFEVDSCDGEYINTWDPTWGYCLFNNPEVEVLK